MSFDLESLHVPSPVSTATTNAESFTVAAARPEPTSRRRRAEAVVREVVQRRRSGAPISLDDDTAVALVIDGMGKASRSAGVSPRTLRRWMVRDGSAISEFVAGVRLEAARRLYAMGWSTDHASSALGYASAAAYRRFLRRSSGTGVWTLRKEPRRPRAQ